MVAIFAPIAIFVGVVVTILLAFFSFWDTVNTRAVERAGGLTYELDRAGITMKPQEIVLTVFAGVALVWIGLVMLLRPTLLMAGLLLAAIALAGALGFYGWVRFKIQRRLETFITQLEMGLRLIASGVKVGLGLRQALAMVIEELPNPARYEFLRVIGQTNIGISVLDAMDDLAKRMPSNETLMMARVIRVQSQSGGDLARVLEQLAGTIRDRRHVHRKISALTSEGRMSALVLMFIPVGLGLFMVTTQPNLGHALLFTPIGHGVLFTLLILEIVSFFWLRQILKVTV
ncbi:MAG: type II secretion system F family protein [Candidatus Tumulicola sp.]